MSSTANIRNSKSRDEMFEHYWMEKTTVTSTCKTQKILQLEDIYSLELSKFMYRCSMSQAAATFNDF